MITAARVVNNVFVNTNSTADDWIRMLKQSEFYEAQIIHVERFPAKPAVFSSVELNDIGVCQEVIGAVKFKSLYTHQSDAIFALFNGHNIAISTSTSSGKSMVYNIPVAHSLVQNKLATAVYLFPTKALAQDQLRGLQLFLSACGLRPSLAVTYVQCYCI
jgi:DEAD/DEAH box helicase domain-containing protein